MRDNHLEWGDLFQCAAQGKFPFPGAAFCLFTLEPEISKEGGKPPKSVGLRFLAGKDHKRLLARQR